MNGKLVYVRVLLVTVEFRRMVVEKFSTDNTASLEEVAELVTVLELNSADAMEDATRSGVEGGVDRAACKLAPIACIDTAPITVEVAAVDVNGYAGTEGNVTEVTWGTAGTVRSLGNGGTAGTACADATDGAVATADAGASVDVDDKVSTATVLPL